MDRLSQILRSALHRWTYAAGIVLVALLLAVDTSAAPAGRPLPEAAKGPCPRLHPERLPSDALAGATRAALDEARALYPDLNLTEMRATEAILATKDTNRGGYAAKCGRATQARTVIVYLEFPRMKPSTSLSEGVVLLSRFSNWFRVWAQLH